MKGSVYRAETRLTERLGSIDETSLAEEIDAHGCATIKGLLDPQSCVDIAGLYLEDAVFRSHIHMARHGFGRGEYKYFCYPLPCAIQSMRSKLYEKLVSTANQWNRRMGLENVFPDDHETYLEGCHKAGQVRPTPLLLRYGEGDFNCLHQDVYGDLLFPIQVAVLLSEPGRDFTGGEFVLTEQRPRMQSRAEVVSLKQGDAVAFAVRNRPVRGTKGDYKVIMRHGVSRLQSGTRHTLGLIFHDAV